MGLRLCLMLPHGLHHMQAGQGRAGPLQHEHLHLGPFDPTLAARPVETASAVHGGFFPPHGSLRIIGLVEASGDVRIWGPDGARVLLSFSLAFHRWASLRAPLGWSRADAWAAWLGFASR